MTHWAVFLDDGGVMNDNRLRAAQWRQLVAEFFVPRLGGTPEAWMAANRAMMERILAPAAWEARLQAASDYRSFDRVYQLDWLYGMCALVSVIAPADADECFALACQATAFILPQVRSAFAGAAEAIRALHQRGYALSTASGEPSTDLVAYLECRGVRECFQHLYGPDLIETFKNGPTYYERIFADAGVEPGRALIVDDSPAAIAWARHAGARAVLIGNAGQAGLEDVPCLPSLADLPEAIERLNMTD
jgi:HAD superfamily hydrolase (TIGR01509 family)